MNAAKSCPLVMLCLMLNVSAECHIDRSMLTGKRDRRASIGENESEQEIRFGEILPH